MTTVLPVLIPRSKNILLLKDEVGKPKPTTRTLPNSSFRYGKPLNRDSLKEQIFNWNVEESYHRIKHKHINSDIFEIQHGIKYKPSTPFDKILKQEYAHEAEEQLEKIYRQRLQTEPRKPDFTKNRSFTLRHEHNTKKEEKKVFKLKQFQDIKCKVYDNHNLIL